MRTGDWCNLIVSLIDGVVTCLPRTATEDVRTTLCAFREQARRARTSKARSRCEAELENYLQSTRQLRTAASKSLAPQVESALKAAIEALARAEHALRQIKQNA